MESSVSRSLDRLLVRARQSSRSALGQLMASQRSWLRRLVSHRLPRNMRRKVDASDLVQEVQYGAAAGFSTFRGRTIGEFRAWLVGILDLQLLRAIRFCRQPRRDLTREEPLNLASSDQGELAADSTSSFDRLCHEEESARLSLAASWCREDDIAIISRHFFDGQSHETIADELGIAPTAVRQRHCRAVRRVGEAMRLLELMTRRGLGTLQQDVIGVHRFQGADPGQLANRFGLPEELVARWIAEARPLFRAIAKDGA